MSSGDVPEVPILLLGDAGVGKSTFLSYVLPAPSRFLSRIQIEGLESSESSSHSTSRLTLGSKTSHAHNKSLPVLHDLDQPFPFNISLYNRPYRFEFYDTASPTNYTLLHPAVIVLCYSIAQPKSLHSLQQYWRLTVEALSNYDESIPVVMLGLMRDIRCKEDYDGHVRKVANGGEDADDVLNGRTIVYPQEALRIAQEMRCDRYCECSAMTGEVSSCSTLLRLVLANTTSSSASRLFKISLAQQP